MKGKATVFHKNKSIACTIDEIDTSMLKAEEMFVKDISEISLFSDFAKERNIIAYYLYAKKIDDSGTSETAPHILFVDSKKLIFGCHKKSGFSFVQNTEYMIELVFPLELKGPIKSRKVFTAFVVERVFNEAEKLCIICRISRIKEEDVRFLDERA